MELACVLLVFLGLFVGGLKPTEYLWVDLVLLGFGSFLSAAYLWLLMFPQPVATTIAFTLSLSPDPRVLVLYWMPYAIIKIVRGTARDYSRYKEK